MSGSSGHRIKVTSPIWWTVSTRTEKLLPQHFLLVLPKRAGPILLWVSNSKKYTVHLFYYLVCVASLFLLGSEVSLIDKHLKITYQSIQKLLPNTPSCVTHFLAGCLPGEANIHLRMLGIFCMVTRLTHDPLRTLARNVLVTVNSSSKSWFHQIRDICLKYGLPHPIRIIDTQPTKKAFEKSLWAWKPLTQYGPLLGVTHMKCLRPYSRQGFCLADTDQKDIGPRIKMDFAIQQHALIRWKP